MATLTRREFLAAAGAGSLALLPGCSQLLDSSADRSLDYLGSKLRGTLIRPDHPEFNALSEPRNLRFASTVPQAVALCVDADDIATALLWARETATPFAIRGGGHNYALASTSPGLIISTRAMSRSTVEGNVLRMQAGALNRDLAALLPNGGRGEFLLPGGNCPNVGVTGATLGGGIGPNAPWAGLAADRLTSATVVTASGHIVTANATTNADLFWALRGGAGGNFGIVTDLQYALVPIPVPRATTVRLRYSGIEATVEAFRAWQRIRALAPRLVCGTCQMLPGNSGTNAAIRAQVLATESGARDLLAPLLAIPAALIEIVERPWWDVYAWYVTPPSPNNSFWDRSLYADADLPDAAFARFASVVARFPTGLAGDRGGSLSLFGWVGGAVSDIAPDATAYVHRAARALIEIGTGWATTAAGPGSVEPIPADIKAWTEELWDTILPYTTRRSYQNFPDPELNGWDSAYYGSNLARLRAVKAAWDPEGAFTYPQAIPVTKERRYVGFFRRRVEPVAGVALAA